VALQAGTRPLSQITSPFHDAFVQVFQAQSIRLFRYLDRLSGDAELAEDLVQETFVRLYRRGSLPADTDAWLITVAMNLFRNTKVKAARRRRLLPADRGPSIASDPAPTPDQKLDAEETRRRVRQAIDQLPERERALLLLIAEGYRYRDIAAALQLRETSVGTLLARAKHAFRAAYEG
jgi:RNA polymerase sigma-70 factor (ECF subfamily)